MTALAVHADGRGAEVANMRAMRHGLRSSRLPKGCERIGRDLLEFRRALEDAVFNLHGEVDAVAALLISSAVTWERHRRLAERWLRVSFDELSHADRLSYSREAAKAATERNKVLEALKLDEQQQGTEYGSLLLIANAANTTAPSITSNAFDATAALPLSPDVPNESHGPANASQARVIDPAGAFVVAGDPAASDTEPTT